MGLLLFEWDIVELKIDEISIITLILEFILMVLDSFISKT